jgi:hypothetical protein
MAAGIFTAAPHGFAIAQNAQEFDLYVDSGLALASYD